MIICLCNGVSDRTICRFIDNGVTHIKAMQKLCQIGKGCGKCIKFTLEIIEKEKGLLGKKTCDKRTIVAQS
jgi:bacterioferritin-associated ferredoxin